MTWMGSFPSHLRDALNMLAWLLVECELLCSHSTLPSLSIPLTLYEGSKEVHSPSSSLNEEQNASLPFLDTSIFRCHSILPSHIYKHLALRVDFLLLSRRNPLTMLIVKNPLSSSQEVSFYTSGIGEGGVVCLGRVGSSSVWRSLSSETYWVFVLGLWA